MNEIPNLPIPPTPPPEAPVAGPPDPAPMDGPATLRTVVDALLKRPERVAAETAGPRQGQVALILAGVAVGCLAIYGLLAGMFSGGVQLWAAPLKITLGAVAAGLLCFPSLYIFSCMSGADTGPGESLTLLCGMLALTSIMLIGFAPVIWIFSMSTEALWFMGALHIGFWLIAAYFGFGFILKGFHGTAAGGRGHLVVWCMIFVLVTLQMTCALRPILGTSDTVLPTEKRFFLAHWGTIMSESASR